MVTPRASRPPPLSDAAALEYGITRTEGKINGGV